MNSPRSSAWLPAMPRDYLVRWAVVAACGGLDAAWMLRDGIGFDLHSLMPTLGFCGLMLGLVLAYGLTAARMPALRGPVGTVNDLLLSLVQLLAVISAMLPLTYLAATTGFPLLDARLSAIDAGWFGFNWDAASVWIMAHPWLDWVQQQVYGTVYWQGAIVLIVGSVTRPGERNREAIWLFVLSLLIIIAVFCFTPALGRLGRSGDEQIVAIEAIRSGRWTVFTYTNAAGIISFPSFHAALAIMLTYCVRQQKPVLAVLLPVNLVMLTAIPTVGGHYLIDMVGGAVVVGIAIVAVRAMQHEWLPFFRTAPEPTALAGH